MINTPMQYKYQVLVRLLKKEEFNDACSKAGLSIDQAKKFLSVFS